jgi:hypothetical protein
MVTLDLLAIAIAVQAPLHVVDVAWPAAGPLSVACPVAQTTRIEFPEPLRRLKTFGPDRQVFSVTVEAAAPRAVVLVRPRRHPARAGIEYHGSALTLRIDLTTAAVGQAQELRLNSPLPTTAKSVAAPSPVRSATPPASPEYRPAPDRPSPPPTPAPTRASDAAPVWRQLQWARAVPIGRREGLPGQLVLVVEDALRNDEWIWYRLRLEGGADERIATLEWEHGPLGDFQEINEGTDRRILVRVPRRLVSSHTRLVLTLASGAVYRVAPFPPTLSGFFKRLFS